jgi:outer membrane murein-binding lipoprotein Lpp
MGRLIRHGAAVLALLLVSGCGQELTVEQQIIAVIREMEARVEAGERRPFMTHIHPEFTAQNGAMNRDQVRALLVTQLNRYKRLQAQLLPIRVEQTGADEATARFRALVTGGPGWIPESGQVYAFESRWLRVDGDWLLLAADWDPVPLEEVL